MVKNFLLGRKIGEEMDKLVFSQRGTKGSHSGSRELFKRF